MPATLNAFGFEAIWHPSGQMRPQVFTDGIAASYSSNIYQNQMVSLATDGTIRPITTTSSDMVGTFQGVFYTPTNNGRPVVSNNWVANTAFTAGTLQATVYTDPLIFYRVQADGSIPATAIGDQAYITNTTSNNGTGFSQSTIGSSLAGAGVQGQVRITALDPTPDNAWGDTYTIVQVQIARHQYVAVKTAI